MSEEKKTSKLNMQELNSILEHYLPPELLAQVRETIHDLQYVNEQQDYWKYKDRMTGICNEQGILQVLERWKTESAQSEDWFLFLCIDIEKLETINQIYGHSEGDIAIQVFGQILEDFSSETTVCGYLGSGEFIVILRTDAPDDQPAKDLLHAIHERIDNYNRISGKEYSLHILHDLSSPELSSNEQVADILRNAVSQKRLKLESSKKLSSGSSQKQEINPEEHRLVREVINKNRFRYAYQPIIDARTGDIYAYEALMRTEAGIPLSPLVILKYATLDDRLYDIEKATFFNVLKQISEFENIGDRKFFVNSISNCQLVPKDYEKIRTTYGHLFSNLVVEITEQTEMNDEGLDEVLRRSREDGFGLAIDDYGTGYSNTSSLLRYLPNCVKIDRLLITGIQENPKKQHFVTNIITFAHDNGFLALAEGVETAAELTAVIHMGIDLIQGFYTAKPDFALLEELPEEIKNEIIRNNMNIQSDTQRKIYIVDNEPELLLMQLALEQYTGIVVSQPELTIIGNPNYPAAMSLKIKDGCTCRLTLRNVSLESVNDLPCIDIGENAHLTLVVDGNNLLNKTGIRVPAASTFRLEGKGDLSIQTNQIESYGIGNDFNSGVGSITCAGMGKLEIRTEGNHCVCIGGGIYREGEGLRIHSGAIKFEVAGVDALGIGSYKGTVPIEIRDCDMKIDFRVASGNAVGSLDGDQNVRISNISMEITGSGSHLCGIGSVRETAGTVNIEHAEISIHLTGQKVRLLGNEGGGLTINSSQSHLTLHGEGNNVLGIGAYDESAFLEAQDVTMKIHLMAAENVAIGVKEENCVFIRGTRSLRINH